MARAAGIPPPTPGLWFPWSDGGADKAERNSTYWERSRSPLTILAFLFPLIVFCEIGTLLFLNNQGAMEVVRARAMLSGLFSFAPAAAYHAPPILIVLILLAWQAFSRQAWRVRPGVCVGMATESFLWTLPLVVLAAVAGVSAVFAQPVQASVAFHDLSAPARLTLSLGAGLYEELLFRLIIIGGVHILLVDIFKQPDGVGYVVGAVASALAFIFYHNVRVGSTGGADTRLLFMYGVAGVYFSALFVIRGFGVAAGTHAWYDCFALLILSRA